MMCLPVVFVTVPVESWSDVGTEMFDVEQSKLPTNGSDGLSDNVAEEGTDCDGHLVVRSTFLHVDDGHSLMQTYRRLRKAKTDFALVMNEDPEVYEVGKFSSAKYSETQQPIVQPVQAVQAVQPVPHESTVQASEGKQETQTGKGKERTTVMLRNLPNNYTRDMLLSMLDEHGLQGKYDFVYLPCDFYRDANLGYAFVNMVDSKAVDELWQIFHGFSDWALPTAKVCEVSWSGPHQGLKAHVERYRNSPVMHKSVPDEYKPMIFKNGVRKPFPRPTKRIQPPYF